MSFYYDVLDSHSEQVLALSAQDVINTAPCRLEIAESSEDLIRSIAATMLHDFKEISATGKTPVFIIPVGPVGQYDIIAERACTENIDLSKLVLLGMDEYLRPDGQWISEDDPLSFRGHVQRHLLNRLPEDKRPNVFFPNPSNLSLYTDQIDRYGGVDVSYCGVGITGHLAFNDPVEGYENPDFFATLPTRIVQLREAIIALNSVTAALGNMQRIPKNAVTVGMKEILGAKKIRIYLNREWQSAVIRRMLFGPVTGAFPASLVQRHSDVYVQAVNHVLNSPEPTLR